MSRQFAVIGMGRVGSSLAQTLHSLGHDVLGIDSDEDLIQDLSSQLPDVHLVAADATENSVLRDLGLEHFDAAAVVIGENVQASILVTLLLEELGLPLIVARATTPLHARVLGKVGADRIIQPEQEAGELLARTMASPGILDYLDLGEDEALMEAKVPDRWIGQRIQDLQVPRKTGLTVLAVKPEGRKGTVPHPDTILQAGDVLIIGGDKKKLDKLEIFDA